MNETKKHLFLFTIGPVQSFIAQARKTGDLYAGSALLSDLIAFALSYTTLQGHKIIFPYFELDNKINLNLEQNEQSYPNRFIAVLNLSSEETEKVKAFGQSLESLVKVQLENLAKKKFEVIPAEHRPSGLCEQIKDFLEIYWTAIPYDDETPEKYSTQFKNLESYLGAIKNVRSFSQLSETGRKCTVNGTYNIKVYRKTEEEENLSRQKIRKSKLFAADNYIINGDYKSITYGQLQPGEGLCGISFFKRLYKDKPDEEYNFPSTAEIALLNLWNDDRTKKIVDDFKNMFLENFDEQLLFDDDLNIDFLDKNGIRLKKGFSSDVTNKQKEIFYTAKENNIKVSKYYALLSFDGDSMGKWLSKAKSEEQHRDFSKLLVVFANKAKAILDGEEVVYGENNLKIEAQKRGQTVYAGGDDFLGFVNLKYLFETIENLKAVFDAEVTKKVKIEIIDKEFTMSMGLTIAHYKTPLREVIKKAKNLEHDAKRHSESKNNIGFCFMTTSSILAEGYLSNKDWDFLKELTGLLSENKLSSKFAFSFAQSTSLLHEETDWDTSETLKNALCTELQRLVKRSATSEFKAEKIKDGNSDIKRIDDFIKKMITVFVKNRKEIGFNKSKIDITNFVGMLKFADKLASKLGTQND